MRVLAITHGYPPVAQAGAELYAAAHARALRALGHDVIVLAREDARDRPDYEVRTSTEDGIAVFWLNNTFRSLRAFAETYRNAEVDRAAGPILDEIRPDAVHIHHLTGLSTSLVHRLASRGIPIVMTLHDYWLLCHRGQLLDPDGHVCDAPGDDGVCCSTCLGTAAALPPAAFAAAAPLRVIARWLPAAGGAARQIAGAFTREEATASAGAARAGEMRAVCRSVTHFLAPSQALRDRFVRFGVHPDRISYAPYGFERPRNPRPARMASDRLRIGFVGTLMLSKGPHVLLDAFNRLPPGRATLDLIGPRAAYHGDRRLLERLEPLLAGVGIRAHGAVPHAEMPARLAEFDVLAVPSIWPENSPLVIHEAFMAGVPVIASDIGGIPEVVRDGVNGRLVPAGDAGALARALLDCVEDPMLLPRLRAGIGPVRDIAVDAAFAVERYRSGAARTFKRAPLTAVVLNFKTPDDTLLAARSLLASDTPLRDLLVVNNDVRADGALREWIDRAGPPAAWIDAGANLGYSGGMNVGIREALARGAGFVLLANSDVIVPPGCLGRLLHALEADPHAGIAGPVIVSRADPSRIESLGLSYDPATGRMRVRGAGTRAAAHDVPATLDVDAVSGCLMLVKRDVFEAIGLFDDAYFFGFEDLDFCLRARRAGFRTVLAGGAVACHEGGQSIGAASPRRLYFAARNHLRLADRAGGPAPAARACAIVALNLAHAARPGRGHVGSRVAAVLRGVRDHRRRRYGPDGAAVDGT
jgi:GT2 family glycosyltransferase